MNLFIAGTDLVCSIFLLIIALSMLISNKKRAKKYNYFMFSIFSLLLFCASDCIAYLMDEIGGNETLHFYSNLFSYAGVDIVFPAFVYYLTEKIRETGKFSMIHARIVLAVSAIDMWFVVWGAYTGRLFRIENEQIVYGYLNDYVGILQFVICMYFLVQLFLNKKLLDKKVVYTVSLYFLLPLLSLVVEFIDPSIAFAYMSTALAFLLVYMVVVREDIQASTLSEKIMHTASVTDTLTGLFNRRAYSEDTMQYSNEYPADFFYMSLDVNGLKKVNDTIGHAAGDEIISGAAQCMQASFGAYGKVYRTGGDEFTAILAVPAEKVEELVSDFDNEVASWHGSLVDSLSISLGYVKAEEAQGISIHDVSVMADKRMYASKSAFYRQKGVDRRGQFEAHVALCNLYTKILKINVSTDTYQIINMDTEEQTSEKGFAVTISEWLKGFGKSGQVHSEDLDEYLQKTDINYLREYFKTGKKTISICYRRKYAEGYKQVVMEMIPTNAYTDGNQELFLYVKSIDK